jgi:hypothetical protein
VAVLILIGGAAGMMMLLYGGAFEADAVTDGQDHGTVMSVVAPALMIETAPDHDTMTFRVESTTQINKDGREVGLEKVVNGDSVTVVSKIKDNERIATSILARTPY